MTVWMLVTKDEFELPVAIADSAKELAELRGVNQLTVSSTCTKERKGFCRSKYKRVEIDDD